jgi:hypothetical protein
MEFAAGMLKQELNVVETSPLQAKVPTCIGRSELASDLRLVEMSSVGPK